MPMFCPPGIYNIVEEAGGKGMDSCMTMQATSQSHAHDSD